MVFRAVRCDDDLSLQFPTSMKHIVVTINMTLLVTIHKGLAYLGLRPLNVL